MMEYKYISTITADELNTHVVIPCTDEDNHPCILIRNSNPKTTISTYSTDNLEVKLNRVLFFGGTSYFFHIIASKQTDFYSKQQFNTIFEYIFKKIASPIDDLELSTLITSLEDYFKTSPDPNRTPLQIGVFGELLVVKFLYQSGYPEIVEKYHQDFYSKHDVEITDKLRMEIKTTAGEKRIHHFKHAQIFRTDVAVYVASVVLEPSKEGYSLYELFNEVLGFYSDPDAILALKKLMIRCGVSEDDAGLRFALEKALNEIRFYKADALPKLMVGDVDGITNVEYDVDCSLAQQTLVPELISVFKGSNPSK
jgi:hypothetical protein